MGAPTQVEMPDFPNVTIKKFIWGVLEMLANGAPWTRLSVSSAHSSASRETSDRCVPSLEG